MPPIEPSLARFLQRIEAVQAIVSMRWLEAPKVERVASAMSKPTVALDVDLSQAALSGPGWYDSSWDLIQGCVVQESAAVDVARLDDGSPCWLV